MGVALVEIELVGGGIVDVGRLGKGWLGHGGGGGGRLGISWPREPVFVVHLGGRVGASLGGIVRLLAVARAVLHLLKAWVTA